MSEDLVERLRAADARRRQIMSERPQRHELHAYCIPCERRVGTRESVGYALKTDPAGRHCDECGSVLVIRFERCLDGSRRPYWRHKKTRRWFGRKVWLPIREETDRE